MNLENKMRPLLRYHGGKWRLAPWIIKYLPDHRIYVEPFGGAASVLLRKPRSYSEVYNDLSDDVVNLFKVARDSGSEIKSLLQLTPFSRTEYVNARALSIEDPLERARQTVIRSFMGFGSGSTGKHYNTGFRSCSNRSGTTPAHDWKHYGDRFDLLIQRLRGVVIEHKCAFDVIRQHDHPDALFYVDPPYPLSTRNNRHVYEFELTEEKHRDLADLLKGVKGKVLISGYPCELYSEIYSGWRSIKRKVCRWSAQENGSALDEFLMAYE